jgi:hypothetical protein
MHYHALDFIAMTIAGHFRGERTCLAQNFRE